MSVVICAYTLDRWGSLQRAVRSVQAQRRAVREIIVVVDHNDLLLEWARSAWPQQQSQDPRSGPVIHVVESTGAPGLSGARNTGVTCSSSEIVAFLDDDAEADVAWMERMMAAYSDPWVVASGGSATPVLEGERPAWWPLEFDWVVGCSYEGLPTSRTVVRNLIGANMSLRRHAVLAVGGFDEGIGRIGTSPLGCEETDLYIRISQRWPRARIVYEPAARVSHNVPRERLCWRYFRARCFAEGRSKAKVAARVGRKSALSAERSYAFRVLPRAMGRSLVDAVRGEDGAGLRAGAIAGGLSMTAAGYLVGCVASFGRTPSALGPRC